MVLLLGLLLVLVLVLVLVLLLVVVAVVVVRAAAAVAAMAFVAAVVAAVAMAFVAAVVAAAAAVAAASVAVVVAVLLIPDAPSVSPPPRIQRCPVRTRATSAWGHARLCSSRTTEAKKRSGDRPAHCWQARSSARARRRAHLPRAVAR